MVSSSTTAANNPTLPAPLNQNHPKTQADWQQVLNQLQSWQVALGILVPPLQQTAAEVAAGVTPTNYSYAPGDLRRYGADPTGVADSSTAIANAIAANSWVFDDVANGGTYLINSALILKSILRISGVIKTIAGTTGQGTTFIIGSSVSNALLHATAFITDVEIDHITFTWQNFTLAQCAIKFDVDARSIRIHDCGFIGVALSSTQSIGINFVGGGTFTGDVSIYHNYITVVQVGIAFAGTCSTVRVLENEIYCNAAIPNSFGINNVSNAGGGILISGNTFETWNQAIQSTSGAARITENYFEGDITWDWNLGSSANNYVGLNTYTGTPHGNFVYNNTTANVILDGGVGYFLDSATLHVYRGVIEAGGTTANGHYISPTFSAGNFTASGSMTWTVASGNVATYLAYIIGQIMTVEFFISSSTVGGTPSTALIIAIPTVNGANQSKTRIRSTITVINNGTQQTGVVEVLLNGTVINCYVDQSQVTNWTASTNSGVIGSISFPIS